VDDGKIKGFQEHTSQDSTRISLVENLRPGDGATKIIKFGNNHPRIQNRDLKTNPVIPGHEVALTVVKAGKNRQKDYRPGDRFIIQADAHFKGVSVAYGYVLPGGLTQYGILGKEILDGDDGRYLIPIENRDMSYSEAALVEPWACVVASYRIQHRDGIQKDGNLLFIGNGRDEKKWSFDRLFGDRVPRSIVYANVEHTTQERVKSALRNRCRSLHNETIHDGDAAASSMKGLVEKYTEGKGFDDVVVLGDISTEILSAAADSMHFYGILNYMASTDKPQTTPIDAGKIHYDRISFVGGLGTDVGAPYTDNLDYRLKGDSIIMFGAGGPMGQMHVQLALENPQTPKIVIATDIASDRVDTLEEKFSRLAKERGISFYTLNPGDFKDKDEYRNRILELNGGRRFDYVVCLAAIPAVIEDSSFFLGNKSIFNIFAGVSKGTIVQLNIKEVVAKSVRYIGSSGSSLEDMEYTLRKVENKELDTNNSVAGVAGMSDVWNGIDAVRTGSYPGKIVVYPHIKNLDLISLKELKGKYPKIGAHLSEEGQWTKEAEDALLDEMLDIE
jgi:threonine dehydrogenase-like Zn-dependent dehydrogenase